MGYDGTGYGNLPIVVIEKVPFGIDAGNAYYAEIHAEFAYEVFGFRSGHAEIVGTDRAAGNDDLKGFVARTYARHVEIVGENAQILVIEQGEGHGLRGGAYVDAQRGAVGNVTGGEFGNAPLFLGKEQLALIERLRELAEADKDGRLAVLPCKAGDTVYEVTSRKTISEYRVKAIRVELFCTFIEWDIVAGFVDKSIFGVPADEIGKTVFLTREEVEKTLEGKR